jgi:hypothetical protein
MPSLKRLLFTDGIALGLAVHAASAAAGDLQDAAERMVTRGRS